MYCSHCGSHNSTGAASCVSCGGPLSAPPAVPMANAVAPPVARSLGDDAGMRMLLPVGRSGWAIAAGYLGLFAATFLPAPLAVIVAIIAIIDLRRHPERHGWGRAIFGLVMGILGSIVLLLVVLGMLAQ